MYFALWEVAGVPGENPHRHMENAQTAGLGPSCCEVIVVTTAPLYPLPTVVYVVKRLPNISIWNTSAGVQSGCRWQEIDFFVYMWMIWCFGVLLWDMFFLIVATKKKEIKLVSCPVSCLQHSFQWFFVSLLTVMLFFAVLTTLPTDKLCCFVGLML